MTQTTISNYKKWSISLFSGLLFFIMSLPKLYSLIHSVVNRIISYDVINTYGCPTIKGVVLHSIVFVFIVRICMW